MVAGSILPVALVNNELYFLFGKENKYEDSAKGWSDFGGGVEKGDTPFQTALREGSEELTGFLGDSKQLAKRIKQNGGFYHIEHNDYHVHIVPWNYDANLVQYYNDNHAFLWKRMNHKQLCKTKLFEKVIIDWFPLQDIVNRKIPFRCFYHDIAEKIVSEKEQIRDFIQKNVSKLSPKNKTMKRRK